MYTHIADIYVYTHALHLCVFTQSRNLCEKMLPMPSLSFVSDLIESEVSFSVAITLEPRANIVEAEHKPQTGLGFLLFGFSASQHPANSGKF